MFETRYQSHLAIGTPGDRIKILRLLTGMDRAKFAKEFNLSYSTLRSWEKNIKSITKKSIQHLVEKFERNDIHCSSEWIMEGTGKAPQGIPLISLRTNLNFLPEEEDLDTKVLEEVKFFKKIHKDAVVFLINDETMAPSFLPGDYVAGIKKQGDALASIVNKICIVVTLDDLKLLRYVSAGDYPNVYHLKSLNKKSKEPNKLMTNVSLNYAAVIIWHRFKER